MATHDLEGGHRYLLVYTNTVAGQDLALIDVDFGRADTTAAVGRGYNVLPDGSTLTIGQVFGGAASAIFSDIDGLEVTGDEDLPVDDWSMVYSAAGAPLGTDCFSSVDTPAGWRGLVGDVFTIDLPDWPPTETRLFLVCF
jgi:hypothetical protein